MPTRSQIDSNHARFIRVSGLFDRPADLSFLEDDLQLRYLQDEDTEKALTDAIAELRALRAYVYDNHK